MATPSQSGNIRNSHQPSTISANLKVSIRCTQPPKPYQQFEHLPYYKEYIDEGVYEKLPPVEVPNERADSRLTTSFTKLIQNGDKYTGLMYNLLVDKMGTSLQYF